MLGVFRAIFRSVGSPDHRNRVYSWGKKISGISATAGRRARPQISTPATYGASSPEREGTTMSRRGRAASEGRGRRCNRAAGNRQPPFHAFLHLHTCAFSLNSSACFLWQVTASMRRREGQARRRKRPRYTKPATHGRLLTSFLASVCTPIAIANRPLDLKIVFNQHPKPLNGITNVFCIGGRSGPVNFLFS